MSPKGLNGQRKKSDSGKAFEKLLIILLNLFQKVLKILVDCDTMMIPHFYLNIGFLCFSHKSKICDFV